MDPLLCLDCPVVFCSKKKNCALDKHSPDTISVLRQRAKTNMVRISVDSELCFRSPRAFLLLCGHRFVDVMIQMESTTNSPSDFFVTFNLNNIQ